MRGSVIWNWSRRALTLGALLLLLTLGSGGVFQIIATHSFLAASPPGVRVDMGGYRLHLYCEGRGKPIVVVSPGVGVWSVQWRKIQDAVAKDTRVCTYDRPGYGWSDASINTPSAAQAAEELHVLLERAGETGPYVLVGESYGGYIVRMFVDSYREAIAAVVLVESAHERQWDEFPGAKALALQARDQLQVARWLSWFGLFEFWPIDRGDDLPAELRRPLVAAQARPESFAAFASEIPAAFTSARQVTTTRSLGSLPLIVVSAGHSFDKFFPVEKRSTLGPMNEKWMHLQDELGSLSTNSVHMVSQSATHGIAREQPEFVIAAIRNALRKGSTADR